MRRIMHYENYSSRVRLNATGGREWYWYNLVVRPEAQGQHLVGKLLRPMFEYCARNGRPAYLETHSEKNVRDNHYFCTNKFTNSTFKYEKRFQISHCSLSMHGSPPCHLMPDWLAMRWCKDAQKGYQVEVWDIDYIKDDEMKWSALREKEDGTRFTATCTWKKIK